MMNTEEQLLAKTSNKWIYPYEPESKIVSGKWKHADSQAKKSLLCAAVSKEDHADSLLGYERSHQNIFP